MNSSPFNQFKNTSLYTYYSELTGEDIQNNVKVWHLHIDIPLNDLSHFPKTICGELYLCDWI